MEDDDAKDEDRYSNREVAEAIFGQLEALADAQSLQALMQVQQHGERVGMDGSTRRLVSDALLALTLRVAERALQEEDDEDEDDGETGQ